MFYYFPHFLFFRVVPYPHDVTAVMAQLKANPNEPISLTSVPSTAQTSIPSSCRFGGRCAVPDCKFTHPPVRLTVLSHLIPVLALPFWISMPESQMRFFTPKAEPEEIPVGQQ